MSDTILVNTNIGGFVFDAALRLDHTSELYITEHPVQTGASITDHSYLKPSSLSIEIGMSDVAESIIPGQFSGGDSRSINAFNLLLDLQRQRIPIQITTRLKLYKNMMIETITAPDDRMTLYGLRATVVFKEILVAQVTTVKVSARPQVTGSTNRGEAEAVKPNESILYQNMNGGGLSSLFGS